LDKRKNILSYEEPVFVKNREAVKQIEMLTESIPQLILQIYIQLPHALNNVSEPNRTEPFQNVTYRKTTVDDRIRP
jgi:septation ring formation regulator EzrA